MARGLPPKYSSARTCAPSQSATVWVRSPRRRCSGARAESGDEDLRDLHLAAVAVDDRHRLAGVVDEQLVARRVLEAHHGVLPSEPGVVVAAERAVLAAVGVAPLYSCHSSIRVTPLRASSAWIAAKSGVG
jgi:hypothetical protein